MRLLGQISSLGCLVPFVDQADVESGIVKAVISPRTAFMLNWSPYVRAGNPKRGVLEGELLSDEERLREGYSNIWSL